MVFPTHSAWLNPERVARLRWLHEECIAGSFPSEFGAWQKWHLLKYEFRADFLLLLDLGAPIQFNQEENGYEYTRLDFDLKQAVMQWLFGSV